MQISEHELRGMTAELDEMHHATYPALESDLQDVGASARKTAGGLIAMAATRRHFLLGTGLAAGGLVLAACGGSSSKNGSTPKAGSSSTTTTNGDVAGLRTNASLENLAVFAYGAALTAAPKGKFGKVPDAVAGFAKHAMKQHSDHAKAFNAALTQAGEKAYTQPDPALASTIQTAFGKIDNVPDLLKLALQLEDTAAETYVKQMGQFTSSAALAAVATIAPVERQHAAILHFVLGQYPVPDTFVPLDLARPDSDAPAA
jgi:hypothetical protein